MLTIHFIIILYCLALFLSMVTITMLLLVYQSLRVKGIIYYIFHTGSMIGYIAAEIVHFYISHNTNFALKWTCLSDLMFKAAVVILIGYIFYQKFLFRVYKSVLSLLFQYIRKIPAIVCITGVCTYATYTYWKTGTIGEYDLKLLFFIGVIVFCVLVTLQSTVLFLMFRNDVKIASLKKFLVWKIGYDSGFTCLWCFKIYTFFMYTPTTYQRIQLDSLLFITIYMFLQGITIYFLWKQLFRLPRLVYNQNKILNDYNLTKRETQIVFYILDGHTNDAIAGKLAISSSTVKNHVSSIFEKTGVRSRSQLIVLLSNEKSHPYLS